MFVRQRLSSEPDRYRGRRRVPTPPRSRYASVGAAAFVGAGVVALGAGNFPDVKAVDPSVLRDLESARVTSADIEDRNNDAERANRDAERGADVATTLTDEEAQAEAWRLPLDEFDFVSPFGMRGDKLHAGIDLRAIEGTPYKAIHGGTVTQAGYNGAYGYSITIETADGIEMVYAHSQRVLVEKGDVVQTGQLIGEVGSTGYSFSGAHLHIETHKDGNPTDPIPLLRSHGVDIKLKIESVYGDLAAS
jgi:murein DD-endopeptidase MepM/ murein hydrolase activator NlpD